MSDLTVGSLFSGIGGFDLAAERMGMTVAWQSEIEPYACKVLARRFPGVSNLGDVTKIEDAPPVDIITFGSPCQDLSVAGKRAGMEGARSGLFFEAVRIIERVRPAFALWENVPGALSSNQGRDFAACLDALADIGALDIGWRVLDAQHFGIPQRRRRVFLVADFAARRAAQILALSEGGDGHPAPRRSAGQATAATLRSRSHGAGVNPPGRGGEDDDNLVYAIQGNMIGREDKNGPAGVGGTADTMFTLNTVDVHAVAPCDTRRYGKGTDSDASDALIYQCHGNNVGEMGTLRAEGTSSGNGAPFVVADPLIYDQQNDAVLQGAVGTLQAEGMARQNRGFLVADLAQITSKANRSRVEAGLPSSTLAAESQMVAFTNRGAAPDGAHETLPAASHGALPMVASIPEDTESNGYNASIGGGPNADAAQTRSREVLRALREQAGEAAGEGWGLGVVAALQQAGLLQSPLHGGGVRREAGEAGPELGDGAPSLTRDDPEGAVLNVWHAEWLGRASQERRLAGQLTRELGAALSDLSQPGPRQGGALRGLWEASERLGLLRQALSAVQEVRRSAAVQAESAQPAGEADQVDNRTAKGAGAWGVRRLTPLSLECERLQGFPDAWTCLHDHPQPCDCPDGARYRCLGNAVAVPVAEWLLGRIAAVAS